MLPQALLSGKREAIRCAAVPRTRALVKAVKVGPFGAGGDT